MRRVLPYLAAATALLAAAALSPAWEHYLLPGQKAFGTISEPAEEDLVHLRLEAGWKVSFTLKARAGGTLLPLFTRLEDPSEADVLGVLAIPKVNAKGTVAKLKFTAGTTGTWVLGLGGDAGSTGTWDLLSKGPAKIPLGAGTIDPAGEEEDLPFDADAGTEATIQVKASPGSLLVPRIARLERPQAAGDLDLAGIVRKSAAKSDTLSNAILAENGTWTLVVTGDGATTGAYAATLKPGKKVALDFTVDPTEGPPPPPAPSLSTVTPATLLLPAAGTEPRSLALGGSAFVDGATVSFSPSTGITNIVVTFNASNSLDVDFDLDATAGTGPRSITVTNPDLQAATKNPAVTFNAPPTTAVTAVSPSEGDGGTRVVVQGTLFESDATVTFGGVAAEAVHVVDASHILCTVPPAATLGRRDRTPVDVVVDNGGGDAATLDGGWTYLEDGNAPIVASTVPADLATGVARNINTYVFVMSEPVAAASAGSVTGFDWFGTPTSDIPSARVSSVARGPRNRFVVMRRNATPAQLLGGNGYRANIPTTVTDVAGNPLDPTPWSGAVYQGRFTVHASATDGTAPTVATLVPAAGSATAGTDTAVTLTFSEAVDPSVLAGAISFTQAATPVPFDLDLDAACTVATLTPRRALAASTPYTVGVSTALRDLCGNTLASNFTGIFTTAAADATAPAMALTVDVLPASMNGSGTYIPGNSNGGASTAPGGATAFNAYLPRSGFTIDVDFTDAGGSGIDVTTFTCTSSVAMGSVGPAQDLSANFTVTPLGAAWTVDAAHQPAAGNGITFTVNVSDLAGNPATQRTLAVDVADITRMINNNAGSASTDRDPFNVRQSWLLRFDQDLWTVTVSPAGNGNGTSSHTQLLTVSTSLSANGIPDFREDLGIVGLNGPETGTGASTVTNGSATGTNAIVQRMVREAVRGFLNRRYGIGYDGTRDAGSAEIEFLLEGETRAGGGTVAAASWNGTSPWSMMTFTGDERANAAGGTIGRALLDFRNTSQEDDSNTGVADGSNLGTFATHMIRVRLNDPDATNFPLTFDPLISLHSRGGTPVGASNDDAVVLDDAFDYGTASQGRKDRYDLIVRAVDRYALYLSAVGAHEIGHSTGLVPDGAPKVGLFGNAHPNNAFIATATYTTGNHIDTAGPNLMEAAASFDDAIATGSSFMTFGPLNLAYLLRRTIHDQ